MKIIIVGTAHPYRGGLAAFNERLAAQFQTEGHEVKVVTFTLQYPSFLFPGKTQYSHAEAPEEILVERLLNSVNPLNWVRVGKKIADEKADLVVFCYWMSFMAPCMGTVARVLKRHSEARCVGLLHNLIPHEPSLLDKVFPQYFVKYMDAFVALSESVVHDVERMDKRGVPKAWSPHPIYDHYGAPMHREVACEQLAVNPNDRYLLFFGFIRAYKGLDLLLEAMADERVRKLGVKVLVAGEFYEDETPYRNRIAELGLEEHVVIHNDFIADEDVAAYFCAADMVVQPYKTATQSGVTQVAFHFEKPMLVTAVGGLAEIVHHGEMGYAVAPEAKEIADRIVDFYENDRNEAFVAKVREEKVKYGWDKMTEVISLLE